MADVDVSAAVQALTLTQYNATVSAAITVQATVEALTLTEYATSTPWMNIRIKGDQGYHSSPFKLWGVEYDMDNAGLRSGN